MIKRHYQNLQAAWKGGLAWECSRSTAAFGILVLLSFAVCMVFPSFLDRASAFLEQLMGGVSLRAENGTASMLFLYNFQAVTMIMTYGLLPFVKLPAMSLGVNAVLLGISGAWYLRSGSSAFVLLASLLPHGLVKLPALFFAFGVGLFVCGQITRRIRRDQTALPLLGCVLLISEALFLVLFPALLAASFLEAYVTPAVASLFL